MDKNKALQKLLNGTASKKEVESLKQALASGEISIGGDMNRSVVIIGSGNKVELTAEALGILKPEAVGEEPAEGEPPYMGLRYFDTSDADLFYGRQALTRELAERVAKESFLAIVGASGSGKSSVARAGLIPKWKKENERGAIHIFTPTAHPLESLAASLTRESESVTATSTLMDDLQKDPRSLRLCIRKLLSNSGGSDLLLVVDQFEETFTLCKDPDERKAFIENLMSLADEDTDRNASHVVLTLRADFYHHCFEYEGLRLTLEKHQANIGAMTQDELREAITAPAEKNGWDIQPGLVDLILQDVGAEPGALPLLSHALLETWKRRQGHMLTLQGYHEAGGVKKAIAQTAESVYDRLSPNEKAIARNIFLRLTELGEGVQDTRRRVKMDELAQTEEHEEVTKVLKTLTDARLVTTEQDSAEVAHEALIREWGTLRKWLDEDRESLRLHRHLTENAAEWERSGRDELYLIHRGGRLDDALQIKDRAIYEFTTSEQAYLIACVKLRDEEKHEREQRLRWVITTSISIAVFFLVLGGIAWLQWQRAEEQATVALARTDELKNLAIAVQANKLLANSDPDLAIALDMVATRGDTPVENMYPSLLDAAYITLSRNTFTVCPESYWATSVDITTDTQRILIGCSGSKDSKIFILDAFTGAILAQVDYPARLHDLVFSPDEKLILAGFSDNTAALWSSSGKIFHTLAKHIDDVSAVAFSPDGNLALTGSYDKTIILWDVATGDALTHIIGSAENSFPAKFTSVEFNPRGGTVVLGDEEGNVIVWDYEQELLYYPSEKHKNFVLSVGFSPDGSKVVSSSADSTFAIWDIGNQLNREMTLDISKVYSGVWVKDIKFAGDETKLLIALSNGLILFWDVKSMQMIQTLEGHLSEIESLSVSDDGSLVLSSARDGSVRLWDLSVFSNSNHITGLSSEANSLAIGSSLLAGTADGYVILWSAESNEVIDKWQAYPDSVSISEITLSPDENHLLTVGSNGLTIYWDIRSHAVLWQNFREGDNARSVDINPTGGLAIVGYVSGAIHVIDIETGSMTCSLDGHTNAVNSVRFSPDGLAAVSGSNDHSVILWNISQCKIEKLLFQHDGWVMAVAFNPNGNLIASASADNSVILWNVNTQQQLYRFELPALSINTGLDAYAISLDFSPDGYLLSSGHANGNLAIWSVTNGIMLRKYVSNPSDSCNYGKHCYWVLSTKFSPDGSTLWASASDGRVLGWHLIPTTNIKELRRWMEENRYIRELTEQEKVAYEIDE